MIAWIATRLCLSLSVSHCIFSSTTSISVKLAADFRSSELTLEAV